MLLDKSQEFGRGLFVLGSLNHRHHRLVNTPLFHPSLSKTKLSLVIFEREVERVLDRDYVKSGEILKVEQGFQILSLCNSRPALKRKIQHPNRIRRSLPGQESRHRFQRILLSQNLLHSLRRRKTSKNSNLTRQRILHPSGLQCVAFRTNREPVWKRNPMLADPQLRLARTGLLVRLDLRKLDSRHNVLEEARVVEECSTTEPKVLVRRLGVCARILF